MKVTFFISALLVACMILPHPTAACVTSTMGTNFSSTIYLSGNSTLASLAAQGWTQGCAFSGDAYPSLQVGMAGFGNIQVWVSGGGTSPGNWCGEVSASNSTTYHITVFERATNPISGATKPCDQTTSVLHEMGHVLGLGDSDCAGFIMDRIGWNEIDNRSIAGGECVQVWDNWITPVERERIDKNEMRCSMTEGGNGTGCGSPLVLDLDDNGIKTTSIFMPVTFDLDGDGLPDEAAWLDPHSDDRFLALDLNQNGVIDSGRELLGDASGGPALGSQNGFEALKVYDRNLDGKVSPQDPVWSQLLVWHDANYNGLSEEGEIRSLRSVDIVFISLEAEDLDVVDGHGNRRRYWGSAVKKQTGRALVVDIFFDYNPGAEQ